MPVEFSSLYHPPAYASARHAVADPHHFILFQHGVMGYAGDFENVITDLFVHHDVSLHEAYEAAVAREERRAAKARARARAERQKRHAWELSSSASSGFYPPHNSHTGASTNAAQERLSQLEQQPSGAPCGGEDSEEHSEEDSEEMEDCHFRNARREAQRRAARREEYKHNQFSLEHTYPFNQHGRLYQTGNLVCFAPGSNNFLGTGSGTLYCSQRMLAEFVPVFRAWLDRVEAARRAEDAEFGDNADEEEDTDDSEDAGDGLCHGESTSSYDSPLGAAYRHQCVSGDARDFASGSSVTPTNSGYYSPPPPSTPTPGLAAADATHRQRHRHGRQRERRGLPKRLPICFSCVGHSFGGLILREFLYLLCVDTIELPRRDPSLFASVLSLRLRMMKLHIHFENFLTVATPHCGTTECLWWPIYIGAWCLAKLHICTTYGELIVSDSEAVLMKRLVDAPHTMALKLFRRRTLFANTHRDLLVGFGTSALIFETVPDDHTKAKGYWRGGDVPCASAFESDDAELSAAIYLPAHKQKGEPGSGDRATTSLPENNGIASGGHHPFAALPPVSVSHTLFDIWEFHHTRSTTTLAPVDPLAILTPAAAAAANALSESVAAAASALPQRTFAFATAAAPTTTPVAPEEHKGHDENQDEDSAAAVSEDDKSADGPWFHYDRFFPDTAGEGNGSASALATIGVSSAVSGEGSSGAAVAADGATASAGTNPRADAATVAAAATVGADPALPPPTMQFPLSKIIRPEEMREKLRAALLPSLSATVVNLSTDKEGSGGAVTGHHHHRHPPVPEHDKDDTADSLSSSSMGATATRTTTATATTAAAMLADGAMARSTATGSTWMWPSRTSLLNRLTLSSSGNGSSSGGGHHSGPSSSAVCDGADGGDRKDRGKALRDSRRRKHFLSAFSASAVAASLAFGTSGNTRSDVRKEARAPPQYQRHHHRRSPSALAPQASRRSHHHHRHRGLMAQQPLPIDDAPASFLTIPAMLVEACLYDVPTTAMKLARAALRGAWAMAPLPRWPLRRSHPDGPCSSSSSCVSSALSHPVSPCASEDCEMPMKGQCPPVSDSAKAAGHPLTSGKATGRTVRFTATAADDVTSSLQGGTDQRQGTTSGQHPAPPPPPPLLQGEFEQREGESEEDYLRRLLQAHMRTLPRSRLTPRAIAHELRRDLDWRVRAVRWNHVIPIAHVAALGNWAWAGTSPNLVKAVAEEIAHIF